MCHGFESFLLKQSFLLTVHYNGCWFIQKGRDRINKAFTGTYQQTSPSLQIVLLRIYFAIFLVHFIVHVSEFSCYFLSEYNTVSLLEAMIGEEYSMSGLKPHKTNWVVSDEYSHTDWRHLRAASHASTHCSRCYLLSSVFISTRIILRLGNSSFSPELPNLKRHEGLRGWISTTGHPRGKFTVSRRERESGGGENL
jgi:hypothetical protein